MKEFIDKTTENLEEKIKVTSLEIIVTGTKDKPYFEIKYREVGKEDYSIGYSSYDLNYAFAWKEECFEIVNELAKEYKGGWITDRVPTKEECGRYGSKEFQVTIPQYSGNKTVAMDYCYETVKGKEVGRWRWSGKLSPWDVLAWKPMDAPYTEGEVELYRAKSVDGEYQEYKGDWK